jgi:DNA-binding transcriptional MocR family regulator
VVSAATIAGEIEGASSREIAATVARLISTGRLAPGDRLPTVRDLAVELAVSPATVSNAWQALSRAGLVLSRGRSGTSVRGVPRDWLPRRYRGLDLEGSASLDLSRGTPDPELLPDLGPALSRVARRAETASYQQKPDIPELHDLLRETWPSPVDSITVTNGALDALDRIFGTLLSFGDRVAVEDPGFPPIIDLLEHYGAEPVPVAMDREGLRPEALAGALGRHPIALVLQPRAQNPTGASMTPERAAALARVLQRAGEDTLVIEDDHSGEISAAPDVTLASSLPARVLHVRSYAKSHGPDLRIGALGGPRALVERVIARRLLGAGWTSRMVQSILYDLLTDPVSVARVQEARGAYAARQSSLAEALTAEGVRFAPADGLNLWLPVRDERAALVHLATEGIRVAPGTPFLLRPGGAFIRVTVSALAGDPVPVAAALATAAGGGLVPLIG